MDTEASRLERDHVHSVYEKIAPHFNDTRYKAWPRVRQFLLEQESSSLIADVGCGNGKYLDINSQAYKVGCDYCLPLVKSAKEQDYEVMVCNGLHLPYRDQCFDAILSIAVIHHFSTKDRRIQAIKEMARTLRVGGKVMIYVWAMEQKRRKFEKQDVFIPWNPIPPPSKLPEIKTVNESGSSVHPGDNGKHFQPFNSNNLLSLEHSNCNTNKRTNCTTTVGMADTLLVKKFLKLWLFSHSAGSIVQLGGNGNTKTRKGSWTFQDCTTLFGINSGITAFEQNQNGRTARFPYSLFSYGQNSEGVFAFLSESRSPSQCNNIGTQARFIGFPRSLQIPESSTAVFQECSEVSLPDLASQAVLQTELHCSPLETGSTASSQEKHVHSTYRQLQGPSAVDASDWPLKSKKSAEEKNEQISYDDACLRYYHVFKQGELVDLVEKHIEDLHVIQAYYDHANWCVIAEKVTIWKS